MPGTAQTLPLAAAPADASNRLSDVIRESLAEATMEMFEEQAVAPADPEETATALADSSSAAVIGFTSEDVRGSVVINIDTPMAIATRPAELGPIAADDTRAIQDWAGELSNQLLGRAKNKVVKYGELLAMSTPMALSARDLEWSPASATHIFRSFYSCPAGRMMVLIAMTINEDRTLELVETDDCASEGDLVFF